MATSPERPRTDGGTGGAEYIAVTSEGTSVPIVLGESPSEGRGVMGTLIDAGLPAESLHSGGEVTRLFTDPVEAEAYRESLAE
jgi:hypothetical protein